MPLLPTQLLSRYRPFRRQTRPGAMPGTIKVSPEAPPPRIHVIAYGPDACDEQDVSDVEQLAMLRGRLPVTWINVEGLGDKQIIQRLGEMFHIHPLALEDVVHTHQRAKVEEYEDQLFIVARMVTLVEGRLDSEQISLFLGKNYLLTFQERPGDCLDPVRTRIRKNRGRIRTVETGYLAYALIDAIVDGYFPVLEEFGSRIEETEEILSEHPSPAAIRRIHRLHGDLLVLKRSIWPHREAASHLLREPHPLVSDDTRLYLRDCYDHTVQIIEVAEMHRDMCSDLRDFYFTQVSHRTNEIMKVLTIIATIFIPLGFIAGLYGMNFDTRRSPYNMPELEWFYGYPFALGLMAVVAGGLLYFFHRRGWIGKD